MPKVKEKYFWYWYKLSTFLYNKGSVDRLFVSEFSLYERRIAAINAVIAVCNAEEGAPSRPRAPQKRPADAVDIPPAAPLRKGQKSIPLDKSDDTFSLG